MCRAIQVIMSTIDYYLNMAGKAAQKLTNLHNIRKSYLLGAVAIRQDGAVVTSINGTDKFPNPMCHAEQRVIRKAGHGATVFVARISRDKKHFKLAMPCPSCVAALRNCKVKKVYYSVDDGIYGMLEF